MPIFEKSLNQTNVRRMPHDGEMEATFRNCMIAFLNNKSDNFCFSTRHNKFTSCTCLKDLLNGNDQNIQAVADIVTPYYQYGYKERCSLFSNKLYERMDRKVTPQLKNISNMKFRGRLFSIRGKFDNDESNHIIDTHNLCMYSYLCIYGIEPYFLESTKKKYEKSSFDTERNIAHGLTGQKNNNALTQEVEQSLTDFFNYLKAEGDNYASKQVRSSLGNTYLRDNELDGVRLPPSYSKKMLYDRWCYNQGWIVGRGADSFKSYKSYRARPFDDSNFPQVLFYLQFVVGRLSTLFGKITLV